MAESIRNVDDLDWGSLVPTERAVLCFVVSGGSVLLIHKKTGMGSGKVNGPGGRIEPGESARDAAIRETQEETGITPRDLHDAARLSFVFTDGYSLTCDVFVARGWDGEAAETREALPFWCPLDQIPYDRMWEDDALWLPAALEGRYTHGRFIFEGERMLSHALSPA